MKKIINGKHYNTDNAVKIGEHTIGDRTRIIYLKEALYKTPRSKDYFLAGESGPLGPYAAYTGSNTYTHGEGIRPITDTQACAWMDYYIA